ncbi:hypothetical protein ECTOBSL9_2748 [Ectothiorhodospira sp. BSL-9]|nr:hypothetical protein ECTOBSL9_2748 [Ectothiorhodospira sp. BSL-9]
MLQNLHTGSDQGVSGEGVSDHRLRLVRQWLRRHRQGALAAGMHGVLLAPLLAQAAESSPESMVPAWRLKDLLDVVAREDGGLLLLMEDRSTIVVDAQWVDISDDMPFVSEHWLASQGLIWVDDSAAEVVDEGALAEEPVALGDLPGVQNFVTHPDGSVSVIMEDGDFYTLMPDQVEWADGEPLVGQAGLEALGLWPEPGTAWQPDEIDPAYVALGVLGAVAGIAAVKSSSSSSRDPAPEPDLKLTAADDADTIRSRLEAAEDGTFTVDATGMDADQLNAVADRIAKVVDAGISGTLTLGTAQDATQLSALLGEALAADALVDVDAQGMEAGQRQVLADQAAKLNSVDNLSLSADDAAGDIEALLGSDAVAESSVVVNASDMGAEQLNAVADAIARVVDAGISGTLTLTQEQSAGQMQSLLARAGDQAQVQIDATGMDRDQLDTLAGELARVESLDNLALTQANSTSTLINTLLASESVAAESVTVDAASMNLGRLEALAQHLDKVEAAGITNLSLTQANSTADLISSLLSSDAVADSSVIINTMGMGSASLMAIQVRFAKVADITVADGQTLILAFDQMSPEVTIAGEGTLSLTGTLSADDLTEDALQQLAIEIATVDIRSAELADDVSQLSLPGGIRFVLSASQMAQLSEGEGFKGATDEATTLIIDLSQWVDADNLEAELAVDITLGNEPDRVIFEFGDDAPDGARLSLTEGSVINFGAGDNTIEARGGEVSLNDADLVVNEEDGGSLSRFNINSALEFSLDDFEARLNQRDDELLGSLSGSGTLRVVGESTDDTRIDLQAFGDNFQPGGLRPPTIEFTDLTTEDVDNGRLTLPKEGSPVRIQLGETLVEGFDQEAEFSPEMTVFTFGQLQELVGAIRDEWDGSDQVTTLRLGDAIHLREGLSLGGLGNVTSLETGDFYLWVNEGVSLDLPVELADAARIAGPGEAELTGARGTLTADLSAISVENLSINVEEGDRLDLAGADLGTALRLGVEDDATLVITAAQADERYIEVDAGGRLEIQVLDGSEVDFEAIQVESGSTVVATLATDTVSLDSATLLGPAAVSLETGQTLILGSQQANGRAIEGGQDTTVTLSRLSSEPLDLTGVQVETFTAQNIGTVVISPDSQLGALTLGVADGQELSLTADQADGREIQGGVVQVGALAQAAAADLSTIDSTLRLALGDDTSVAFTGSLPGTGRVRVTGQDSELDLREAQSLGEGGFSIAAGTTVVLSTVQIPGAGTLGEGHTRVTALEDALDADLTLLNSSTVTAELDSSDNPQWTGNLGSAVVVVSGTGIVSLAAEAVIADARLELGPDAALRVTADQTPDQLSRLLGEQTNPDATILADASNMDAAQRQVLADQVGNLDSLVNLSLTAEDTVETIEALLSSDAVEAGSVAFDTQGLVEAQLRLLQGLLDKIDFGQVTGPNPIALIVNETQGTGFMDLAEAIAAAEAGDVLQLQSGEYTGDVRIDKPLTLLGPNQGVSTRDAEGNPLVDVEDGVRGESEAWINGKVTIAAPDVTLDGLRLHHVDGPLTWDTAVLGGEGAGLNDFSLLNSYVTGYTGDKAPSFMGGSYNGDPVASGWNLSGNLFGGVVGGTGGALYLGGLEESAIADNVFWRPGAGHLYLSSLKDVDIEDNYFYHGLHAGGANFDGLAEFLDMDNGYGGEGGDALFFGRNFWMEIKGQNEDVRIVNNEGAFNSGGIQLYGEGDTAYRFDNFVIEGNQFSDFVNADPDGVLGAGRAQSGLNGAIAVSINEDGGHSATNLVIKDNQIVGAVDQVYSVRDIVSLVEVRGNLEDLVLEGNQLTWSGSSQAVRDQLAGLGAMSSEYDGVIQGIALSGGLSGEVNLSENLLTAWADAGEGIQQLGLDIRRDFLDGYGEFDAAVRVPEGNTFAGWDMDVVARDFEEGGLNIELGEGIGFLLTSPMGGEAFMAALMDTMESPEAEPLLVEGEDGQFHELDLSSGGGGADAMDSANQCVGGVCLWDEVVTPSEVL